MMTGPVVLSKTRMVCSANGRASLRSPALKAGWPQRKHNEGGGAKAPGHKVHDRHALNGGLYNEESVTPDGGYPDQRGQ